jgi:hypothetical protein
MLCSRWSLLSVLCTTESGQQVMYICQGAMVKWCQHTSYRCIRLTEACQSCRILLRVPLRHEYACRRGALHHYTKHPFLPAGATCTTLDFCLSASVRAECTMVSSTDLYNLTQKPNPVCADVVQTYSMIKFEYSASQFLFFVLFETLGLLLFTSLGIAAIALTPNVVAAAIISGDICWIV